MSVSYILIFLIVYKEFGRTAFNKEENEYYVHYSNFDRRLDEWISFERIDITSQVDDAVSDKLMKDTSTKSKKQKVQWSEFAVNVF